MPNSRSTFICSMTIKPHLLDDINAHVGQVLSKRFGGVTTYEGNGFWSKNGNDDLIEYSDNIEQCKVLIIHLSVMPDLECDALSALKSVFAEINDEYKLGNTHLHVEKQSTTAHHITI